MFDYEHWNKHNQCYKLRMSFAADILNMKIITRIQVVKWGITVACYILAFIWSMVKKEKKNNNNESKKIFTEKLDTTTE